MLIYLVLLLLRSLLLRRHHPYQAEHFFHADPYRIAKEGVCIQLIHRLRHVRHHEPHRTAIHHLPMRASIVRLGYFDPWREVQPRADTCGYLLCDDSGQYCNRLVLRTAAHTTSMECTVK